MTRGHLNYTRFSTTLTDVTDGPWLMYDNSTLARDAVGPSTPTTRHDFDPEGTQGFRDLIHWSSSTIRTMEGRDGNGTDGHARGT